jgi:hypothetical protein
MKGYDGAAALQDAAVQTQIVIRQETGWPQTVYWPASSCTAMHWR